MPNSQMTKWLAEDSIIQQFMNAYTFAPGQTPKSFYLWAIISAIVATAKDKFYFCKFPGKPTLPNLYVFLVAPSGVGKGTAIGAATDYLKPYKPWIKMFVGRVTHASWMKYITTPLGPELGEDGRIIHHNNGRVSTPGYLVTEELAWCLSSGDRAKEFLRLMTAIYTASGSDFEELTNQYGYHSMENPCSNWLAGTTKEWLLESVGMQNLLSGFASRTIWVIEENNPAMMQAWPTYPPEFAEIKAYLEYRFSLLHQTEGCELVMAPEARYTLDKWYAVWHDRYINETDKALHPLYARGHDLAVKLSQVARISAMDIYSSTRHIIKQEEVEQAIIWTEDLMLNHYRKLLDIAYKSKDKDVECVDDVAQVIQSFGIGACTRSALTKRGHGRGLSVKMIEPALRSLMEQGKVESVPGPGGRGVYYLWADGMSDKEKMKYKYLPKELN